MRLSGFGLLALIGALLALSSFGFAPRSAEAVTISSTSDTCGGSPITQISAGTHVACFTWNGNFHDLSPVTVTTSAGTLDPDSCTSACGTPTGAGTDTLVYTPTDYGPFGGFHTGTVWLDIASCPPPTTITFTVSSNGMQTTDTVDCVDPVGPAPTVNLIAHDGVCPTTPPFPWPTTTTLVPGQSYCLGLYSSDYALGDTITLSTSGIGGSMFHLVGCSTPGVVNPCQDPGDGGSPFQITFVNFYDSHGVFGDVNFTLDSCMEPISLMLTYDGPSLGTASISPAFTCQPPAPTVALEVHENSCADNTPPPFPWDTTDTVVPGDEYCLSIYTDNYVPDDTMTLTASGGIGGAIFDVRTCSDLGAVSACADQGPGASPYAITLTGVMNDPHPLVAGDVDFTLDSCSSSAVSLTLTYDGPALPMASATVNLTCETPSPPPPPPPSTERKASIKITKTIDGTSSSDLFSFDGDLGTFQLSDGHSKTVYVDSGSYDVQENLQDNWQLETIDCTGTGDYDWHVDSTDDTKVTIDVEPLATVSCEFVNQAQEPPVTETPVYHAPWLGGLFAPLLNQQPTTVAGQSGQPAAASEPAVVIAPPSTGDAGLVGRNSLNPVAAALAAAALLGLGLGFVLAQKANRS